MCRSNVVDLTRSHGAPQLGLSSLVLRLGRLTVKYRTLLALRVQREHLESNGVFALAGAARQARRDLAMGLAREFPGSLRELDCRDAAAVAARLHELANERARAYRAPNERDPERAWVSAVLAYHEALRRGLQLRRAARQGAARFAPEGLVAWACADVAAGMGCVPEAVRQWVFEA